MSHHSLSRLSVFAAAAWLLSTGVSFADGPPAQDTEQRLKALEMKMDRVLNLLGNRGDSQPSSVPDAMAAIEEARTKIRASLAARLREFETMRDTPNTNGMLAERIGKLESIRQETKIKMQEMADQLVRIHTALRAGGPEKGNAAAMRIIRALGLHADDAKSCMEDLQEQINVVTTKIETLTNMIEQEKPKAREMNAAEVKRERLQAEIDRLRHMLAGLDGILQAEPGPRPR